MGEEEALVGEIISRFEKKGFKLTGLKLFECLCVCMSCVECSGFSYCWDRHVVGPVVLLLSMTKIKEARGYSLLLSLMFSL